MIAQEFAWSKYALLRTVCDTESLRPRSGLQQSFFWVSYVLEAAILRGTLSDIQKLFNIMLAGCAECFFGASAASLGFPSKSMMDRFAAHGKAS